MLSDSVLVMHGGVVVGNGLIDDVLDRPNHPYVEGLAIAWNHEPTEITANVL